MVTKLKPNEVFVFGSNLAGLHYGGAAAQAHNEFGAEWGVGEGLTGNCYAFPTLTESLEKRAHQDMQESVNKLYAWAAQNPNKTFLLTSVGTGIAGYDPQYIQDLFGELPKNIIRV